MTENRETLKELKAKKEALVKEMDNFEIDQDDFEDQYCEAIDEQGPVKIGSLEYTASYVLRKIDPTAYRCGLNDYVDGIDKEDTEGYKELEEQLEALDEEISDLEEVIEEQESDEEEK
jgi:hypothetical protein